MKTFHGLSVATGAASKGRSTRGWEEGRKWTHILSGLSGREVVMSAVGKQAVVEGTFYKGFRATLPVSCIMALWTWERPDSFFCSCLLKTTSVLGSHYGWLWAAKIMDLLSDWPILVCLNSLTLLHLSMGLDCSRCQHFPGWREACRRGYRLRWEHLGYCRYLGGVTLVWLLSFVDQENQAPFCTKCRNHFFFTGRWLNISSVTTISVWGEGWPSCLRSMEHLLS